MQLAAPFESLQFWRRRDACTTKPSEKHCAEDLGDAHESHQHARYRNVLRQPVERQNQLHSTGKQQDKSNQPLSQQEIVGILTQILATAMPLPALSL